MINRLLFAAALGVLLGGCGAIKSDLEKCHKPQEYQRAELGPRVRIPDGLEPLDPDNRLQVPFGETRKVPTSPDQPCLVEPPDYTDRSVN